MTDKGIIYIITNLVNSKYYIGQTISKLNKRWIQHKSSARKNCNKCVYLETAIRKYGEENFNIRVLEYCLVSELDGKESIMIKIFKSNDGRYGYNIREGGNTSRGIPCSDIKRKQISVANRISSTGNINITDRVVDGVITGYVVQRVINRKRYTKNFANTKFSLEENLQKAKDWLESLESGNIEDSNRYNRTNDLPKNISYNINNKKVRCGYTVKLERDGKRYIKSFTFQILTMEEKLKMAIEYKEKLLQKLSNNQ